MQRFDVSDFCNDNSTNRINWYVYENLTTRICLLILDVRKFSCAKISTFTVVGEVMLLRFSCSYQGNGERRV